MNRLAVNRLAVNRLAVRRRVLQQFGAGDAIDELLAYCDSPFDLGSIRAALPLAEEPHVADWRGYARDGGSEVWNVLRERLPQLEIPIREGISATEAYGRTIRRGVPFDEADFGGTMTLVRPEALQLQIHDHPAGALPVLMPAVRADFETLYRALAGSSEPLTVNPSVNAQLISGIVNWDRVGVYRERWAASADDGARSWPAEMAHIATTAPEQFYDRVILIGRGAYSSIAPERLGFKPDDERWLEGSTKIRLEHEFTHYATKRLFGAMRLNLFDELLADCMGMAYALGAFRASWFLLGLGIEPSGGLDPRGRVHAYRGTLSDRGFGVVCALLAAAASRVESLADRFYSIETRGRFLLALADLTLELLAADEGDELFEDSQSRALRLEEQQLDGGSPQAPQEGRR